MKLNISILIVISTSCNYPELTNDSNIKGNNGTHSFDTIKGIIENSNQIIKEKINKVESQLNSFDTLGKFEYPMDSGAKVKVESYE